ncbi:iron ABC transporter substrate-binding protein [Bordetella genomosp. 1]|uniref:Iron ABC transporter substrate-binding protein n=1 Tax=Bordetella genomosp. 1 TaxID=1395607 RepID=A0A261SEF6_9BORD|nr:ABC transporter substrate-binding protein [Bordetella genomosp. 1]OZI35387.1 iron ABC transporter substrate-binding protein [Bordetella genomosp. 1]
MTNPILRPRALLAASAATLALALALPGAAAARTVTDLAGRQVDVPDHPKRILLGEGRFVFAMALLDRADPTARIVGWQGELKQQDPYAWTQLTTSYPRAAKVPLIGKSSEDSVSPERIVDLQPDVAIFGLAGHGPGKNSPMVAALQAAGIPVVFIDFRQHPVQNTVASMKILGAAVDRPAEAQAYVDFYSGRLKAVQDLAAAVPEAKRPRVFVEMLAGVWPPCCHTTGTGSLGDLVEAAGGVNIARGVVPGAIGDVSLEFLLTHQPDVYVATGSRSEPGRPGLLAGPGVAPETAAASLDVLLSRPGIKQLDAVQAGRAHGLWHAFYNSPYNILALEALATWLHPEAARARGIDPEADLGTLYGTFLSAPVAGTYWTDPGTRAGARRAAPAGR